MQRKLTMSASATVYGSEGKGNANSLMGSNASQTQEKAVSMKCFINFNPPNLNRHILDYGSNIDHFTWYLKNGFGALNIPLSYHPYF